MDLSKHKSTFEKALDHYRQEVTGIRTGRASSSLVDDLEVEHYGGKYKVKELATVSVPESRTLLIQPWDKSAIVSIEKAIRTSHLGLNPVTDSQGIKLIMPALNEERRQELIKLLGQKTEEARQAVRHIRGKIWDEVQEQEKSGAIREGDKFRAKEGLQKMVDEYNKKLEEAAQKKEQELLT